MRIWAAATAMVMVCGMTVGCSQRPTAYRVEISPSFSPSAEEGIIAAFDSWKSATGMTGDVAIADCTSSDPTTICVREDLSLDSPRENTAIEGLDNQGNVTIYSNSLIEYVEQYHKDSRTEFERIAAHELGHAFGLGHSANGNVMAPTIDQMALTPTAADVEAFWNAR